MTALRCASQSTDTRSLLTVTQSYTEGNLKICPQPSGWFIIFLQELKDINERPLEVHHYFLDRNALINPPRHSLLKSSQQKIISSCGNVPSRLLFVLLLMLSLSRFDFIHIQPDSPYKNGIFHFDLQLPENFPFKAPTVCPFLIFRPGQLRVSYVILPINFIVPQGRERSDLIGDFN